VPGYEIVGELGAGGMGTVYQARDPDLGRDLALKVLLQEHQGNPGMLRRFLEEAQIGGQLQHPGVVPVYALGCSPGDRPFFTMKLVKGRTLADLLAQRPDPAQDLPRFLGVFGQVGQTLAYAHSKGVVHRDLKPSNVMVGASGRLGQHDGGCRPAGVAVGGGPAGRAGSLGRPLPRPGTVGGAGGPGAVGPGSGGGRVIAAVAHRAGGGAAAPRGGPGAVAEGGAGTSSG
jgi:serine/threonine protein kinase